MWDPDEDDAADDAAVTDALAEIEDLMADDDFAWASDTLTGIFDTISRTGRVTTAQRGAIDNIRDGGERWKNRR